MRNDPPPVLQFWEDSFTFELKGEFAFLDAKPRLVQRQSPSIHHHPSSFPFFFLRPLILLFLW
jgi:hypothetical protein